MKGSDQKVLRVALYGRVSTPRQDMKVQQEDLRRVAAFRGWEVAGEFWDQAETGSSSDRPQLNLLMTGVRRCQYDVVAVWKFDRFSRSMSHLVSTLNELTSLGVEFYSYRETIDTTTPIGKAMFGVIAAMAEFERDLVRERVIAGVRRAQAKGIHCGRPKILVDAATLKAANTLLSDGWSFKQVARAMGVHRSTLRRRMEEGGNMPTT